MLEEIDGERLLPIWVGLPEAEAIVIELEAIELPRPGAHQLSHALLRAAGGEVAEVRISTVVEHVFYATVVLADGSEVDARPSDALALALVAGAPITAQPAVLESSSHFLGVRRPEFADEVAGPHDGASVLADETRELLAQRTRKLAELDE